MVNPILGPKASSDQKTCSIWLWLNFCKQLGVGGNFYSTLRTFSIHCSTPWGPLFVTIFVLALWDILVLSLHVPNCPLVTLTTASLFPESPRISLPLACLCVILKAFHTGVGFVLVCVCGCLVSIRAALTWIILYYMSCDFMSRYDDMSYDVRFISEIVIYHCMKQVITDSLT